MADPEHRAQAEGDDARDAAGGEARPRGVFGNLPKHRPGTRSPRREGAARAAKAQAPAADEPEAEAKAQAEPELGAGWDPFGEGPHPLGEEPRPRERAEPGPGGHGLNPEELAWGAIAIAAQAATLGVRLANRALGALIERPERR